MSSETPTALEWTADTVIEMGGTTDWQVGNEIATAHNAALVAERKKWEQRSDKRDEQEAEYVGKMTKELTAQIADRKQLRDQLAAEREAWDKQFTATMTVLGETQQQLAAAVEALNVIMNLLDEYGESEKPAVDTLSKIEAVTDAAIAKLGMGNERV